MALTATRLSPGVYSVNGKTIQAASSTEAISKYQKLYGTTSTTSTSTTSTSTSAWNETLSNELSNLMSLSNPTQEQVLKAKQLQDIKRSAGQTVTQPIEQKFPQYFNTTSTPTAPAPTTPTAPAPTTPTAPAPAPTTPTAPAPTVPEQPGTGLTTNAPSGLTTISPGNPVPVPITNPFPTAPTLTNPISTAGVTNTTDADAINRLKAIMQIGETYGRNIANEFYPTGSLGRIAETNSPEELAALAKIKEFAATAGLQSDAVRNLLAQQQGILSNAQQLSPLELEALGIARKALPGLEAPEMEALRSAARQNIQGQMQAGLRDLAKAQARNQVFGGAATAQRNLFQQAGVREGRNLERDLLVKNIDIKQAAQNAFTNLATNTEANRANRTNAASGQLSGTTLADEDARRQAQGSANATYAGTASNLANSLNNLRQFNLNQAAAEKAGQVGSIFSGMGAISEGRGLLAGEDFANQQYKDAQALIPQLLKIYQDSLKSSGL